MSKYYAFTNRRMSNYSKATSLAEALCYAKDDETLVFKRVEGVPNPWWLHPVKNGKVVKDIILKGDEHKTFIIKEKLKEL